MRARSRGVAIATLCLLAVGASGLDYELSWFTIDGGGGPLSGGAFELTGSIGQPDATAAGALSGGGFSLTGGFLGEIFVFACPSNLNSDEYVDNQDVAIFVSCVSGPAIVQTDGKCQAADLDHDMDVDSDDFGILQRCYSGPYLPDAGYCQ